MQFPFYAMKCDSKGLDVNELIIWINEHFPMLCGIAESSVIKFNSSLKQQSETKWFMMYIIYTYTIYVYILYILVYTSNSSHHHLSYIFGSHMQSIKYSARPTQCKHFTLPHNFRCFFFSFSIFHHFYIRWCGVNQQKIFSLFAGAFHVDSIYDLLSKHRSIKYHIGIYGYPNSWLLFCFCAGINMSSPLCGARHIAKHQVPAEIKSWSGWTEKKNTGSLCNAMQNFFISNMEIAFFFKYNICLCFRCTFSADAWKFRCSPLFWRCWTSFYLVSVEITKHFVYKIVRKRLHRTYICNGSSEIDSYFLVHSISLLQGSDRWGFWGAKHIHSHLLNEQNKKRLRLQCCRFCGLCSPIHAE